MRWGYMNHCTSSANEARKTIDAILQKKNPKNLMVSKHKSEFRYLYTQIYAQRN